MNVRYIKYYMKSFFSKKTQIWLFSLSLIFANEFLLWLLSFFLYYFLIIISLFFCPSFVVFSIFHFNGMLGFLFSPLFIKIVFSPFGGVAAVWSCFVFWHNSIFVASFFLSFYWFTFLFFKALFDVYYPDVNCFLFDITNRDPILMIKVVCSISKLIFLVFFTSELGFLIFLSLPPLLVLLSLLNLLYYHLVMKRLHKSRSKF